jgi:hypothetical protein
MTTPTGVDEAVLTSASKKHGAKKGPLLILWALIITTQVFAEIPQATVRHRVLLLVFDALAIWLTFFAPSSKDRP